MVQNEAELRASVIKATADGAKVAAPHVPITHDSHEGHSDSGGRRRMVVRKKAKRKHANALPITIGKSSHGQQTVHRTVIDY